MSALGALPHILSLARLAWPGASVSLAPASPAVAQMQFGRITQLL
eukprot:CAMPEP_0185196018 /NCGR_PEP_ID=MMETSP1140-20130426/36348_1 /TAXON_ID=298111 /ORGANISM="Pavlova sp., Strain CCMP459" /LENGTH=44 /DNA_ID= /DNA_START= /DNA_END= /DNA_ORIENTATION=